MSQSIQSYHKTNLSLWSAVLSGIVILSIVVYYLSSMNSIEPIPGSQDTGQVLFIIAVILAIGILIFKRFLSSPERLVSKLKESQETDVQQILFQKLRRNYIVIWAMAELICFLGFFNFIMLADLNNYLIFAVVSIYSILINMPREGLVSRCLEMLQE